MIERERDLFGRNQSVLEAFGSDIVVNFVPVSSANHVASRVELSEIRMAVKDCRSYPDPSGDLYTQQNCWQAECQRSHIVRRGRLGRKVADLRLRIKVRLKSCDHPATPAISERNLGADG